MGKRSAGPEPKQAANGSWWFTVDVGRSADGKRRQAFRRGFLTKESAQATLDEIRRTTAAGLYVGFMGETFESYLLIRWLPEAPLPNPAIRREYRQLISEYILPTLGHMPVRGLTSQHLDQFYSGMFDRSVKLPVMRRVHVIVRSSLADAVESGLFRSNPADVTGPWFHEELRRTRGQVDGPTTLYRIFGEDGSLIYVGISAHPVQRIKEHSKAKPWWGEVANVTMEHFPTRRDARRAEDSAILSEMPIHNIQGALSRSNADVTAVVTDQP